MMANAYSRIPCSILLLIISHCSIVRVGTSIATLPSYIIQRNFHLLFPHSFIWRNCVWFVLCYFRRKNYRGHLHDQKKTSQLSGERMNSILRWLQYLRKLNKMKCESTLNCG